MFSQADAPTVRALDRVSMAVHRGEVVGIAEPSDSGKSTLLHLLAGLDVPTEGSVTIAETEVGPLSQRQRARLRLEMWGLCSSGFTC